MIQLRRIQRQCDTRRPLTHQMLQPTMRKQYLAGTTGKLRTRILNIGQMRQ